MDEKKQSLKTILFGGNEMRNERGMTLIEVVAVLVIVSLIAIALISLQRDTTKQLKDQQSANLQLQQNAAILKRITKEVREKPKIKQEKLEELKDELGLSNQDTLKINAKNPQRVDIILHQPDGTTIEAYVYKRIGDDWQ